MATKTITQLIDDLDGTPITKEAGLTVRFSIDSQAYEIDLSHENAAELRQAFSRYIDAARKVTGRRAAAPAPARATSAQKRDVSPVAVREWAKVNNIAVSPRGRISQSVVDQFTAAGN